MKVIIDARTNIPYGSFYIKGLEDTYGKRNVSYSARLFKNLPDLGWNIRFIVKDKDKLVKVFIHTLDTYQIQPEHYDWCDIYGNVNANSHHYPTEKYPKQISLVPSFAVRNYTLVETLYHAVANFIFTYSDIVKWHFYNKQTKQFEQNSYKNIRRHFLNYLKNYLYRNPIEEYTHRATVRENYVFFLSTLWYSDAYNKNDEGVNKRRAIFIQSCKGIEGCVFEGGLVASQPYAEFFASCVTKTELKLSDWLAKTKQSVLVFNTPAFWDCHGWKLGEYLALGKAIISTPLSNDLPVPLVHGEHIHFVENADAASFDEAIRFILTHPDYRRKLETNARNYWESYGDPTQSIKLLPI